MSPRISVVIATYNAARYVAAAVESALGQTLPPLEVIVVDDGSTDETGEVLHRFGDRIRRLWQPNRGPAAGRNHGIRESRGELIAFLDADDVWFPEKLEKQWRRLRERPEAGMVHSDNFWLIEATGERVPERAPGREARGRCYGQMFLWNGVTLSTAVVRRECLDRVGWFDESIRAASSEDYDLFLRLSKHYEFAFVDELLALHREHSSNATKARLTMLTNELRVVLKSLRDDPDLPRLVGRRNARGRLFDLCFGIGYLHHNAGRRVEARACFRQAVATRPWRIYPAFLYAMNLLPAPWARTLRRCKAKLA